MSISLDTLFWLIVAAAILHILEECATGFLAWFRRAIPALAPAMTVRWLIAINVLFLLLCLGVALGAEAPMWIRLISPGVIFINALLHVLMTALRREYSPGLFTAIVLYVPLSIWCAMSAHRAGAVGAAGLIGAMVVAAIVHGLAPLSLRWSIRTARPAAGM